MYLTQFYGKPILCRQHTYIRIQWPIIIFITYIFNRMLKWFYCAFHNFPIKLAGRSHRFRIRKAMLNSTEHERSIVKLCWLMHWLCMRGCVSVYACAWMQKHCSLLRIDAANVHFECDVCNLIFSVVVLDKVHHYKL